ncbi:MAG: thiol reductant ABC exporter subunit CydC [Anaerolineales bacterium]|nr:thiol reductant ABC exporter subunit CydC [Anaerolineales bacterium]
MSGIDVVRRLLRLLEPSWMQVALAVLLGTLTICSSVALMGTSAFLISMAALQPSIAVLQTAIVAVRLFGIARGVFRYLERYVSHTVTFKLLARLRVWFYTALEPLAPARLLQYRSGDLLSRAVADVETLEHFFVRVVAPPVVALLVAVLVGVYLGEFSPVLVFALLAFMLLAGIGVPLLTGILGGGTSRRLIGLRTDLQALLVDAVQGMADLIANGQGERIQAQVAHAAQKLANAQRRMAWISGLGSGLGVLLHHLGMWSVLVLGVWLAGQGAVDGVYLATLALMTLASFEAVMPLPETAQHLEGSLEAGRRLFEIVDAEPEVVNAVASEVQIDGYGLVVKDLSFQYAVEESFVLQDIEFYLPEGGRVAIVGPSGAGKSTLVNLLLRFWDYDQGEIRLGGRSIKMFPQTELRKVIGVVSQSTYLFNASVRQNLLIANPAAGIEQIELALHRAGIFDFVQSLPDGLDTWVGEHGLGLSGGERQRLAIARTLLKDAPVLLLDEPTANLDALTERAVMAQLLALAENKTTLLITHRLIGLEAMDEILVLQAGRIMERGTHTELIARDGLYRQMEVLQRQSLDASKLG